MGRNYQPKLDNNKETVYFYAKNATEFTDKLSDRYQVQLHEVISVDWCEKANYSLIQLIANDNTAKLLASQGNLNQPAVSTTLPITPSIIVSDADENVFLGINTIDELDEEIDLIKFSQSQQHNQQLGAEAPLIDEVVDEGAESDASDDTTVGEVSILKLSSQSKGYSQGKS